MEADNARKPCIQLPNEVWVEIFQKVDTPQLLDLSLVCKHWNRLIFNHLSHKFVLSFNLDRRKHPRRGVELVPERSYKNLSITSFKLNSPTYLLETVKQLANNLVSLKLELVSLECQTLVQLLPLCSRMRDLHIKAKYFECDDTLQEPRPVLEAVKCLSFEIENYVSTFHLFSFEMSFLRMMPNVQQLKMVVYRPLDLGLLVWMAPRLKTLKVTVYCDVINSFLCVRMPALKTLDLTLLQPEQMWRKRRTFQAKAFEDFLRGCCMLQTALLMFRCEYDQQLLTAIFTSLPLVETLQLSGGLATERFSLSGMERMKNLKDLSLHCLLLFQGEQRIVQMPTVEKFSLCSFVTSNKFCEVLKRFPNLKTLSFQVRGDELQSIKDTVPLLEDLSLDIGRVTPDMINHMKELVGLKKLTISAYMIAKVNFRLLRAVIALPDLKNLDIKTRSNIPTPIASAVAAWNRGCKLTLNGEVVQPSARIRRSGVKRKRPTAAPCPDDNQSVNESVDVPMDESQPSGSGPSTSGCSSLSTTSPDSSDVSFPGVQCSSPKRDRSGEALQVSDAKEIPEGEMSSGGGAASMMEVPNAEGGYEPDADQHFPTLAARVRSKSFSSGNDSA